MRAQNEAGRAPERRLAILLPDLSGGGAERMAVVLANSAASQGIPTTLILLRGGGPLRTTVEANVEVVELGCPSTRSSALPLRGWIRRNSPEVLLITPSHLGWAACAASIGLPSRPRIFVREASTLSVDLSMMSATARRARLLAERLLARNVSRIALCDHSANDLALTLGLRRSDIHVIPNPVISRDLRNMQMSTRLTTPDAPVLLAAGRLVHQKGFDTLIRAFDILRLSRKARLLIAGDGPELEALQRLAQQTSYAADIEFAGYREDLLGLMRAASTFVLPSRWEGLPGVLIEALVLGTPVVATGCPGGSSEILEDGRWGELVAVDDSQALAAAMGRALDSPRLPPDETWMRRYSVETAISGYLAVMGLARN